jgi:hypothetical protein
MGLFHCDCEKQLKALRDRIEEVELELETVRKCARRAESRAYRMNPVAGNPGNESINDPYQMLGLRKP